jgi:predicted metal-dependent HD superfamily phosphohydrolase
MREKLFLQWQETLQNFKIDANIIQSSFSLITQVYNSPQRHYHNLRHVSQVLETVAQLKSYPVNLAAVKFAAWLHDVVYNTQASDNEEKSAIFARELLTSLGIDSETTFIVESLILATKNHSWNQRNIDSQVLIDADLMILAAGEVEYQEYATAIRQEYHWVAETDYIKGRKRVLEQFLLRPQIYQIPEIFRDAEKIARRNIQAEISQLTQKIGCL